MKPRPCMGGWCALRERCPHYHSDADMRAVERLCEPGRDGELSGSIRLIPAASLAWRQGRPNAYGERRAAC